MALFKVSFKYERTDYSEEQRLIFNENLKIKLQTILANKDIRYTRLYAPGRNTLKAIFPSEIEVNKIFANKDTFNNAGINPIISLTLKAKRTIFCTKFDISLIQTYSKPDILEFLKNGGWEVVDIYILKNNRSLKIEFKTIATATKFLNDEKTSIGGIFLHSHNKEQEVDPIIPQCWQCGEINPGHGSRNCPKHQVCLRCGERGHKFFQCYIPKNMNEMSIRDKSKRYCIPCKSRGDHTSLDHTACPKQREIIRERARIAREAIKQQQALTQRDRELIQNVLNLQNTDSWPKITSNPLNIKISTLISLALIEEAVTPGCFEGKLASSCEANGIPAIKYKLEPNTAKSFYETLTGQPKNDITQNEHPPNLPCSQSINAQNIIPEHTGTKPKQPGQKFVKDMTGGKKSQYHTLNFEEAISRIDNLGKIEKDRQTKRQSTPYKIRVDTQLSTHRENDSLELLREAHSTQSEVRNSDWEFDASSMEEFSDLDYYHCNNCNMNFLGQGFFHEHMETCAETHTQLSTDIAQD